MMRKCVLPIVARPKSVEDSSAIREDFDRNEFEGHGHGAPLGEGRGRSRSRLRASSKGMTSERVSAGFGQELDDGPGDDVERALRADEQLQEVVSRAPLDVASPRDMISPPSGRRPQGPGRNCGGRRLYGRLPPALVATSPPIMALSSPGCGGNWSPASFTARFEVVSVTPASTTATWFAVDLDPIGILSSDRTTPPRRGRTRRTDPSPRPAASRESARARSPSASSSEIWYSSWLDDELRFSGDLAQGEFIMAVIEEFPAAGKDVRLADDFRCSSMTSPAYGGRGYLLEHGRNSVMF